MTESNVEAVEEKKEEESSEPVKKEAEEEEEPIKYVDASPNEEKDIKYKIYMKVYENFL